MNNLSSENAATLQGLKEFFISRSVPAFLVGGYLRDTLRCIPSMDIDIAVEGDSLSLAKDMANALPASYVSLSPSHKVARITMPSAQGGNRWAIDVSSIKGSIFDDLARRDFSVDALALTLEEWGTLSWQDSILDPFGGKSDLSRGVIRAINPSVFQEDPARLLRGVRLAAKLGFQIDHFTAQLIIRDAHLITSAAGERVRDEFLAILSLDGAKVHLETLDELGLLCCIISELGITKAVEQPKEHHWDVFGHSIHAVTGVERVVARSGGDVVSSVVPWGVGMDERFAQEVSDGHTRLTILKLGALLHDIAKPQTKMVDAKGKTRFLGHHTLGASMLEGILHRLRLSNRGVEMICGMVENHLRPTQMSQGKELPTPKAVYRYFRDAEDVAIDTLYLSLADHLAARGPDLEMEGWLHHVDIVRHILEVGTREQSPEKMPRLITGHDLIHEFGMTPGPLVGILLEGVKEAQVGREIDTREKALAWAKSRLDGISTGGSIQKVPGS